jgi:outer membrane immunogenic protein
MKFLFALAISLVACTAALSAAGAAPANGTAPETAAANWTGFYVGGDIGGLARKGHGTSDFFQDPENPHTLQGQSLNSSSGVAGVHVGFNWQFAPSWVAGIESDWQWTRSRFSACREIGFEGLPCVVGGFDGVGTVGDDVQSFGTVRGRLGMTFDRTLVYGTGGAAFTDVRTSLGVDCSISGCSSSNPIATTAEFLTHKTGWVAGGGIERMFGQNWIIRAEYLHADFGNLSHTLFLPSLNCFNFGTCGLSWSRNLHFDIVRAGVSYKFGGF